ncbi:MAG: inner membrane CreD family protein [Acidobacteriales bacterium]|nr:inner membrane CreD family protein [Terriglobales bacterium]
MVKRIAALSFIFLCTSLAWVILGSTLFARTFQFKDGLRGKVESSWGTAQTQEPPSAEYYVARTQEVEETVGNKTIKKTVTTRDAVNLPVTSSRIDVTLKLDHRQKGLLWYSTYGVDFRGDFGIRNTSAGPERVRFRLPLPASEAVYDGLQVRVNGTPLSFMNADNTIYAETEVAGNAEAQLQVSYHSQGMNSWRYQFGNGTSQVNDFSLAMHTDFKDIDVPERALSPTAKVENKQGWDLTWKYGSLITGLDIGMAMPDKLQPGPLAGQISFFAPVSLFFFFFIIFLITTLRGIDLHPMNYFFLATAFFAFHLLMAYLVDHISIHAAFVVCSAVSIFLVVSYLRLVVGMRFAAVEAGISQFLYLVLFSYAFFFKGFTGLAVTIGSIVTLFVVMQMTGKVRWEEKFRKPSSS